MTFRRIMLLVLPLLAAVFIFMVFRWLYRDWEASLSQPEPTVGRSTVPSSAGKAQMKMQGLSHDISKNLRLERKDREGNLEMRFTADLVEHNTDKTADIERPQIQFFSKSGEIMTLLADKGHAITKGALTNINDIESAVMWGNVVLVNDRGTPDDTSDDILVGLQDLKYNAESHEITTDGPIVLVGLDMQLTAHKMRLTLDPKTRRINIMTFFNDIHIVLQSDRTRSFLGSPLTPAPEGTPPAVRPGAGLTGAAAAPASKTAPKVAVPAATATDAADFKGEMWRIDLAGDVDGRQGIQRLLCERLSLYNKSSKQPAEPGTKDTTTPGKGGARTKAAAPKGDGPARNQEGAAAASARFLQPDAPPPLVIMADGPLIVTPVGVTEQAALGDARFEVAATGAPAVVDDGQTHIVGAEVHYNTKTGSGSVLGKEAPMLLEQPGRLHLTGGRLDFDRVRNTAEVMGGGQLHAQVQSASFGATGKSKRGAAAGQPAAPPAGQVPPAPPELSTLDATWTKGMRMEFYRLPANLEGGATEIKQAIFHGQSVVKQRDGILKGDELVIDFFAPEQGRGQAVERLRGHGDVYIKNEPVEAKPPAPGEAPPPVPPPAPDAAPGASTGANKMAVGDIKCQNIDMLFARDAAGDAQAKNLKASGAVLINDPQGKIKAEDLTIAFAPSAKGGGLDAQFLEATGNVLIDREDLHAEGDHVHRDLTTGMLQLEGKPARAARGQSRVVGPYIEFNQNEGRAIVRGAGELEMPTTTDLRGRQRAQPEPMIVTWRNGMLFEDHRNFAEFDGAASAATGTTRLNGDRLWVYFADQATDATKVGALGVPAAASAKAAPAKAAPGKAVPAGATKTASAKDKSKGSGGDMQDLFGHKQLVRVLAENNVRAIEQQLDPDKTLRFQLEMFGDNLTYLAENRKAYIRGPGLLRTCSRERGKAGESQGAGIEPPPGDTLWKNPLPDGYSRTDVAWTESMAFDGAGNRAYFKGKVDALNIGRGAPGDAAAARRRASEMRIRSGDMQVVFTEKQPLPADGAAAATMLPATAATAPAPAVKAPATPATAAPQEASREERMTVEKLVADGNVQLWIDDRRGIAERLIYQRDPQLIRLYRGTDDWARLWQENEASQEFGEIVARVITYEPGTGRVEVVDQQAITIAPKAKPEVKSKAGAPGPAKPLK